MRFAIMAAVAALWALPAQAAAFFEFSLSANTAGTQTYYPPFPACSPSCAAIDTPVSNVNFTKSVFVSAFSGATHYVSDFHLGTRDQFEVDLFFDDGVLTASNLKWFIDGPRGQQWNYSVYRLTAPTVSVSHLRFVGNFVPEPTTWALMLAGFGGIGFAMRRRRHDARSLCVTAA